MTRLGSRFRAKREERGCTLDDIVARTKIPRRLLIELERDDFTHWPASRVYRIGYLRAYAAAVGLDAAQVIAQFDAEIGGSHSASFMADDARTATGGGRRPLVSLALVLAGCLFGALLLRLPLYVEAPGPPAEEPPIASRPATDVALAPETPVVPTSGGPVEPSEIEGELRIDSIPPGTHVVVNGIARGATPLRLRYLPAGSYTIRLVRDGYESKEVLATISSERPVRSISMTLRERVP